MLGYNQLVLGALLVLYSLWRLHHGMASISEVTSQLGTVDPDVLSTAQDLTKRVSQLLYGSLILFAVCGPGALALYYFSRAKIVAKYVNSTPQWIITMQKSGVAI